MLLNLSTMAALLTAWAASAQGTAPASFDVRPSTRRPVLRCGQWRESKAGEDRIDFRYVTLRYCVAFAYSLKEYQVSARLGRRYTVRHCRQRTRRYPPRPAPRNDAAVVGGAVSSSRSTARRRTLTYSFSPWERPDRSSRKPRRNPSPGTVRMSGSACRPRVWVGSRSSTAP